MKKTCLKLASFGVLLTLMAACEQQEKKDDPSNVQVEQTSAPVMEAPPATTESVVQPPGQIDAKKAAELEKCKAEGRTDCK